MQRNRNIRRMLARFCTLRTLPPPRQPRVAEQADEALSNEAEVLSETGGEIHRQSDKQAGGIQTWLQWLKDASYPKLRVQSGPPTLEGTSEHVSESLESVSELCYDVDCRGISEADENETDPPERRRNPPRKSRPPVDIDLGEWGFFLTPNPACGRIASSEVDRIKRGDGPPLRRHPDNHPWLWCRLSVCCPGANYGLFFKVRGGG